MLRVRYSETQDCADIVSVRQQDRQFVAVCRSWADKQEATGTGTDQTLAIIHAAMGLFQPGVQPTAAAEVHYVIESDRHAFYRYDPDSENKPLTADMFSVPAQFLIVVVAELRLYEVAPKTGRDSRIVENSGEALASAG